MPQYFVGSNMLQVSIVNDSKYSHFYLGDFQGIPMPVVGSTGYRLGNTSESRGIDRCQNLRVLRGRS